ncbi:MAG: rhomboid family intramembrane serine protease [Methylacidiphilales bacterium]|nr:rhomboid family intramembrane serine protease [Candidatus Methylacidiphilales bacterium]MDW8349928.1 rhomboid family intramembrane serine protease [Verrucomicrobiae bacterium]
MTRRIIAAIIVIQLLQLFLTLTPWDQAFLNFWGLSEDGVKRGWIWQLFTYAFLHADTFPLFPLHILMNVMVLSYLGRAIEAKSTPRHLWRLFIYGSLGAAVLWLLSDESNHATYVIGASGAGFAFLTAYAVCFPDQRLRVWLMFFPVVCKARTLALGLSAFEFGCVILGWFPFVAHTAHLGGAMVGWWYGRKIRAYILRRELEGLLPGWEFWDSPMK